MDQISALAHKLYFPPVSSPAPLFSLRFPGLLAPSVGDNGVIKIHIEMKVALILIHYTVSVSGVAGDLL